MRSHCIAYTFLGLLARVCLCLCLCVLASVLPTPYPTAPLPPPFPSLYRRLNIHARRPDSVEHRIQREQGGIEPWGHWPFVLPEAYEKIAREAQPLFRHWVATEWVMSLEDARRSAAVPKL